MSGVEWMEQAIEGPEPIEKVLLINGEPVGVAFIDPRIREYTLAWPTTHDTRLATLLDEYLSNFLPQYEMHIDELQLEYWIGDSHHENRLQAPEQTSSRILSYISQRQIGSLDQLELLQLSVGKTFLEIVFDPHSTQLTRIGLILSKIYPPALARFFSQFHRDLNVRIRQDVALSAFNRLKIGRRI